MRSPNTTSVVWSLPGVILGNGAFCIVPQDISQRPHAGVSNLVWTELRRHSQVMPRWAPRPSWASGAVSCYNEAQQKARENPLRVVIGILVLLFTFAARSSRAESAPIFLDGTFGDWSGAVELADPAGDGVSGVDLREVDIANDGECLFIRFETTTEVGLQEANNLVLYLDTDMNAATGTPVNGIGAELRWQFGARTGTFYRPAGSVSVFQDDLRYRSLPSITSPEFEISLGRNVRPDGVNLLFTGNSIRVQIRHEVTNGDQAPNASQTLTYAFDATAVTPPAPLALARQNAADVRIVTWNVLSLENDGGGWNAGATPSADRVFSAIDPDIVCFQEIYDNTAAATAALMETFLPSGVGEAWYARKNFDVIVVSRFPVLGTWNLNGSASDTNLAVLLDTQAVLGRTLLLISAHMFCCTNNAGRQAEADRIAAFFADAKNPGGSITVPTGTAFVVTGDLNLVGFSQQLRTLLNGDIVDNATFGPDTAPDWDATSLADVISRHTEKRFAYTWRSDTSSFAPGRLDFLIYNDSVLEAGNHFILYTPEMSAAERTLYGLQAQDVTTVSDHLPHVGDFRDAITSDVGSGPDHTGDAWAVLSAAAPTGDGRAQVRLDLDRAALGDSEVVDARGARVATLRNEAAGELPPGQHRLDWDAGRDVSSGVYVVRVVARSGDLAIATSTKLTLLR